MEKYPYIAKFSLVEDVGFDIDTIMCQEDGGYSSPEVFSVKQIKEMQRMYQVYSKYINSHL